MKLIVNLICSRTENNGIFSLKKFDHYSLYRRVTVPNKVGYKLKEEYAQKEYMRVFESVKKSSDGFMYSSKKLFYIFVLTTVKSIELNNFSCSQLSSF